MGSDDVWEKFLPKVRKGNNNSSLSQVSTSSLFSKDGRLSLSKAPPLSSLKVIRVHQELAITPPRPSTSENSNLWQTPRTSTKFGTPSTSRKRSSKKNTPNNGKTGTPLNSRKRSSKQNTPSDGKTQKSLHAYFSVSATKKYESFQVKTPEVVEITSDSSSDEESYVLCEKNKEKSSERKTFVTPGVSRVLFPSTSTTTDKDCRELLADTYKSLSPSSGRDKENLMSPPVLHPKSTACVDRTTEKVSEDVPNFKRKVNSKSTNGGTATGESRHTCITNQHPTIASPVIESEVHHSSVGPCIAPSPVPVVSSRLGNLVKNVENEPNVQDSSDKGKKKMNTLEISKDSRGGEINHSKVTERTIVNSNQYAKSVCPNSAVRENSFYLPVPDFIHSPIECASQHEPSLGIEKSQSLYYPLENFTGVTECFSFESSGDLWTPGSLSFSSSQEFDDTCIEKAARLSAKKKNRANGKTHQIEKNRQSRNEKRKRQVSKSTSTSKPKRKYIMKTTGKETVQHTSEVKSVADVNGLSTTKSLSRISSIENISEASTLVVEGYNNFGGFFSEDEDLETPQGQAFVIRSPSVEYLQNYGSLDENSIIIEKDEGCSDNESEKSSVLADISAVDIVNSTIQTLGETEQANVSDKTTEKDGQPQDNSSASTVPAGNDKANLNYQDGLRGVTLTESEWDRLPSQSKMNQVYRMIIKSMDNTCESLTSTPGYCSMRNTTQDSSFSTQTELVRGWRASQDLLAERAASPNEGEEAPFNGMVAATRQSACQPEISSKEIMSPYSHGMSSHSTEIRLSSAIAPIDPSHINQNVSPNKENIAERIASNQKVLDWFLKQNPATGSTIPLGESSLSLEVENSGKHDSALRTANKGNKKGKKTLVQNTIISSSEKCSNVKLKSCQIICQLKVYITHEKHGERLKIRRKNCVAENKYPQKANGCRKANAFLTTEIIEIPFAENKQLRCGNSKISVNAKIAYGKWGWEGVEIECLDEGLWDSDSSVCKERMVSSMLSIQKVCINLCKCSRSLLIECFVLHNEVDDVGDSVGRSKFHTSLKDYESCWGVPDNPVTLTSIAYTEICNPFNYKLANNNAGYVNPSIDVDPDSLSQILQNVKKDSPKAVCGTKCQDHSAGIRKSAPVHFKINQRLPETSDSISDLDDTCASESSDLEWMTEDREASKRYGVDQWKSLMKKMRDGRKSSESASESVYRSSEAASSSFSSISSQGTYSGKGYPRRVGYGQERRAKVCPFYKKIEGTRFTVDAFSYGSIPGVTHYFLSHFHSDHYMGLNRNFSHPIYCSSITAKLVALKLRVKPNLIRKIDPGQTIKVDGVTVTALDANHCPGSLMLLFHLPGGTAHLHVGDFRAHPDMESYHAFWNIYVDRLYLDTTYCNPAYTFSSQERVIENVLSIVDAAIAKDPRTLIVCGTYTIGKERVFAAIAEILKFKVWAPADKRKVLECVREGLQELNCLDKDRPDIADGGAVRELKLLGPLAMLTMLKEDAQVHVLPMAKINGEYLKDHLSSIRSLAFTNIVAFRPTGWAHGRAKGDNKSNLVFNSASVKIYEVAYSEHSSFQEMARFVKFIKPATVVKTVVGSAREREAMEVHINSWLREAHSKVPVPNRVSDSPTSFQVAEKQRKDGDFISKRRNYLGRRLSTTRGSDWSLIASDNVQNSSQSTHFTGSYIESKQKEERTTYQGQLQFGVRKRIGSPLGREATPKKHQKRFT